MKLVTSVLVFKSIASWLKLPNLFKFCASSNQSMYLYINICTGCPKKREYVFILGAQSVPLLKSILSIIRGYFQLHLTPLSLRAFNELKMDILWEFFFWDTLYVYISNMCRGCRLPCSCWSTVCSPSSWSS